ncbi:hypothetical protein DERF_014653 [Dermatophagoides farinae]|uniref:Uncharacterized protein n=1 Tax=Dermatophagoides farinae TaxID=6954 RepID=A0A922HNB0_DERFA|nr:hypothetical protein DERF_014653 [Dermatophagoides farinae]
MTTTMPTALNIRPLTAAFTGYPFQARLTHLNKYT